MRAWAEIDRAVLVRNVGFIKKEVGSTVDIMAIVGSDAYGHGINEVVKVIDGGAIDSYGVISMKEAYAVREISSKPILVMGYLDTKEIIDAIEEDFIVSLYDKDLFAQYERFAARLGKKLRIQLKVETGFNRLGISVEETVNYLNTVHLFPHLKLEGVYSHLIKSADKNMPKEQLQKLQSILVEVGDKVPDVPIHLASSNSLGKNKESYLDMVRVGQAIYGLDEVLPGIEQAMTCKSVVAQVKQISKGEGVSYGHLYIAPKDMQVAIISIGYADGLSQSFFEKIEVLIQGKKVPIVGQICMNNIIADVTGIEVHRSEEVVITGSQKDKSGQVANIRLADLSKACGISTYEIASHFGSCLPKIYN